MGLFSALMRRRTQAKAEIKAAQARARQEVKSAAQLELKRSKLLAAEERRVLKNEKKNRKAERKHQRKMAKTQLQQLKAGRFNSRKVMRYSAAIRTLLPLLLPLIYKLVVALRETNTKNRAKQLGISVDELATHSGPGAELKARISGLKKSLNAFKIPQGFKRDAEDRLNELQTAVSNAEKMTPEQRKRALRAITADLDELDKEIMARAV